MLPRLRKLELLLVNYATIRKIKMELGACTSDESSAETMKCRTGVSSRSKTLVMFFLLAKCMEWRIFPNRVESRFCLMYWENSPACHSYPMHLFALRHSRGAPGWTPKWH